MYVIRKKKYRGVKKGPKRLIKRLKIASSKTDKDSIDREVSVTNSYLGLK